MFHLIPHRSKLLHIIFTSRDSKPHNHRLFVLLLQPPPSSIKPFSSIPNNNPAKRQTTSSSTFTLSYLINSCGLSQQSALSASQKIQLKSPKNPDSVLTLFRNYGFTKTQIANLISKCPRLLFADPEKTLLPKIQFFHGLGMSGPVLTKILSSDYALLRRSLEHQIIPSVEHIKTYIRTNEYVLTCIHRSTRILRCNLQKVLEEKVPLLRGYGLPESQISKLITFWPRVLMQTAERFNEIVSMVKGMGFDVSKRNFILAIGAAASMSRLKWEQKANVYRSLGWSEDEFISAFKVQPHCMTTSEKKIKKVMSFFTKEMGWKPSDLSKHPSVLLLSFEKRIMPRCSVFQVLLSKGLIRESSIMTALVIVDKAFLEKFIASYQESVPEILGVYQGKMALYD